MLFLGLRIETEVLRLQDRKCGLGASGQELCFLWPENRNCGLWPKDRNC